MYAVMYSKIKWSYNTYLLLLPVTSCFDTCRRIQNIQGSRINSQPEMADSWRREMKSYSYLYSFPRYYTVFRLLYRIQLLFQKYRVFVQTKAIYVQWQFWYCSLIKSRIIWSTLITASNRLIMLLKYSNRFCKWIKFFFRSKNVDASSPMFRSTPSRLVKHILKDCNSMSVYVNALNHSNMKCFLVPVQRSIVMHVE